MYLVSEGMMNDEDLFDASENLRTGYAMSAVAFTFFAVGNVLGALHMAALGKRLSPASLRSPR